jgi:phosphatidate cytidylyltransferase
MNQFLRSLTPTQQVAALFLIVFGLLVIVSTTAFLLSFRERRNPVHDAAWQAELAHYRKLLGTTWFMVIVFWIGWALGETVATVLFALIAFFALREFITLSPTRRGDHRSLILAFFVVLPIQCSVTIGAPIPLEEGEERPPFHDTPPAPVISFRHVLK